MKRKIFTALLSFATIICMADGVPQVALAAHGFLGVQPFEEFTFTIAYYNVQEMVIKVNGVPDGQWLWWWNREQLEWNYVDYTDRMDEYNMTNRYRVIVINDNEQSFSEIEYSTPYIGR